MGAMILTNKENKNVIYIYICMYIYSVIIKQINRVNYRVLVSEVQLSARGKSLGMFPCRCVRDHRVEVEVIRCFFATEFLRNNVNKLTHNFHVTLISS
jgi:hypothetical protein